MATLDDLHNFLDDMAKNLPEIVDKAAEDIGDKLVEMMRSRIRLGYGAKGDGEKKEKLRPLKASTIEHRRRLSRKGELFPGARPGTSQLTATGEMTEALSWKQTTGKIIIFFNSKSADTKADGNENGRYKRPFFHLTDLEVKRVEKELDNALNDVITELASRL